LKRKGTFLFTPRKIGTEEETRMFKIDEETHMLKTKEETTSNKKPGRATN
jgi:hypothetical protein